MLAAADYCADCMLLSQASTYRLSLAIPLLLIPTAVSLAQPAPAVTAEAIIQRAVERSSGSRLNSAQQGYTYTKVNVTEEIDGKGKVKQRKERVFQVNFRAGSTCVKLIEDNGHAPDDSDLRFQAETQSNVHQFLGQPVSGGDNLENFFTSE